MPSLLTRGEVVKVVHEKIPPEGWTAIFESLEGGTAVLRETQSMLREQLDFINSDSINFGNSFSTDSKRIRLPEKLISVS
jgi:hypothetical protein